MPLKTPITLPASLALFILLLSATPTARPQAPKENLKTATRQELDIVKVLLKQEAAWNEGDIDGFSKAYKDSPDTLFINGQIQRGFASLVTAYHRNYPTKESMGNLSFTDLEVHPLDENFALCLGRYHLERSKKAGGNAEGIFSLTLEKTEAGWKIVVDHTT